MFRSEGKGARVVAKNKSSRSRRFVDPDLKKDTVAKMEAGMSLAQAAREAGRDRNVVKKWPDQLARTKDTTAVERSSAAQTPVRRAPDAGDQRVVVQHLHIENVFLVTGPLPQLRRG